MSELDSELGVFSEILVQQYIRLMTAAVYHRSDKKIIGAKFKISSQNYIQMMQEPVKASLIGLDLQYDEANEILSVVPDAEFLEEFENNIMHDVALKFYDTYRQRYASYILLQE